MWYSGSGALRPAWLVCALGALVLLYAPAVDMRLEGESGDVYHLDIQLLREGLARVSEAC